MKKQIMISLRRLACLAPVLALIATASGATLHVAKKGANSPGCGRSEAAACQSIQYTITNRAAPGDLILIGPGIYSELVTISKNLTLRGRIWDRTIIDGDHMGTAVVIASGVVTLESLTIRKGSVNTSLPFYNNAAGGILNQGVLTLITTLVTGNSASTTTSGNQLALAGGIANAGTLNIDHSGIIANTASGGCSTAGGLVNFAGTVNIADSLIADNSAGGSGCSGPGSIPIPGGFINVQGGAVVNTTTFLRNSIATVGSFALDRSTVSNSPSFGIANGGQLQVTNSTISGNGGDGIFNLLTELTGIVSIGNSTVAANAGTGVDFGRPIASTMRNSILAGNGGGDCIGSFNSGDYNLIQNLGGCSFVNGGHDLTGVPANLLPLGYYGGPTATMKPRWDSPAVNGGNPVGCVDFSGTPLTTDQRGFPRPAPAGSRCDVGSVELQLNLP